MCTRIARKNGPPSFFLAFPRPPYPDDVPTDPFLWLRDAIESLGDTFWNGG